MNPSPTPNVFLPKIAILDRVDSEIDDVKTFYWHFKDPADQEAFRVFRPGQFAQVSIFGVGEFPASLPPSPTENEYFFTIRQVGSVTAALHQLKPGAVFGVRGPYGNGFPMEEYYGRNLVFVAGGIGLIPLRSCIVYALHFRKKYKKIQIFYGSRVPKDLLYLETLRKWQKTEGFECHLTVDRSTEGWNGPVGVVGSLFKKPGVSVPVENTVAFVCGPPIMFRFVIRDLKTMGFEDVNIVSTLERYMKCGVGKCGHCCIGVAYVCVDGPVFTYAQIQKLGEEI
ncbi:MAG: FAD/NAD(P)-binding protein [Candidatus Omnitrophica bacterium]|nr:FAD/NAD(P)-binding protein [Candidatus Omnitrophota bacterium]